MTTSTLRQKTAICVPTFSRPAELRRLLLTFRSIELGNLEQSIRIVVVDNDPAGSAAVVCSEEFCFIPYDNRYITEPRRGIAHARNRAVHESSDCDFVAFIDDDEIPDAQWLSNLLDVQLRYGADVVCGPVLPRFELEVPEWVRAGRFFERERYKTGTRLRMGRTGNVLVKTDVFRLLGGAFDERFCLTGGEDTEFFLRVHEAGLRIVWADEACVWEITPVGRGTLSWLSKRAYQHGNSWVKCEYAHGRFGPARIGKAFWHLAMGCTRLLPSLLVGKAEFVRCVQRMALGAGMLAGAVGSDYKAYARSVESGRSAGKVG